MSPCKRIHDILVDCLYNKEEIKDPTKVPEGAVLVNGITQNLGFEPTRLQGHKEEILKLAREIVTDDFLEDKGGMTFLNLCMDREGNQWGEHRNMEQLLLLCMAIGKAKILLPREMWKALHGGMPYISFDLKEEVPA